MGRQLGRRVLRVRRDSANFVPRNTDRLLNWGCAAGPDWTVRGSQWINAPAAVALAANKIRTFERLAAHQVSAPLWTANRNIAQNWLDQDSRVLARTILNGSGGAGIVVCNPGDRLPAAPLYTMYQNKKQEFRVHVFNGAVIDVAEKRRRTDADRSDPTDALIRNHDNGWVFCHDNVTAPRGLYDLAISAVRALGLDFGAVDIIWNRDKGWVLEVNTAPGIEGTTLEHYTGAVVKMMQS